MEANVVAEPNEKVTWKEMAIAIKGMKPRKTTGPSKCAEMISASGEAGIKVIMKLYQSMVDE